MLNRWLVRLKSWKGPGFHQIRTEFVGFPYALFWNPLTIEMPHNICREIYYLSNCEI